MIAMPRSSGILLHPTSLPGKYGIGDLGAGAYRFVDWLEAQGQSIWQVLPLGPTSYGDSPYQTLSAFAGNSNLISFDRLVEDGLLNKGDLADTPPFPVDRVDYGWAIPFHNQKLALAYRNFAANPDPALAQAFRQFVSENRFWLEDFALVHRPEAAAQAATVDGLGERTAAARPIGIGGGARSLRRADQSGALSTMALPSAVVSAEAIRGGQGHPPHRRPADLRRA